ncbi:hypothetical protein EDEG_01890 [Edhazardia aedis USNM 41457]|uniref:Uncharacterized protein n=1 Tax=Edhazardia aedis (strain USNM 41457) TaxID=1003232 RepID=J8ZVV2_EDHAE|nr:hypothetical protein EDEG_01890 [Edhazardia aedis USNM 41457]|eukprot:EJW03798.1 hypothetical protein EDEG_01890 [Edhazardia aedis USNM 41457]
MAKISILPATLTVRLQAVQKAALAKIARKLLLQAKQAAALILGHLNLKDHLAPKNRDQVLVVGLRVNLDLITIQNQVVVHLHQVNRVQKAVLVRTARINVNYKIIPILHFFDIFGVIFDFIMLLDLYVCIRLIFNKFNN